MLQTSFSKLKKHTPTNIYIIYPMSQSVAQFHVEIDKEMPPQGHVHCHHRHPKTKSFWCAGPLYQNLTKCFKNGLTRGHIDN
jgi:hypothetical protein